MESDLLKDSVPLCPTCEVVHTDICPRVKEEIVKAAIRSGRMRARRTTIADIARALFPIEPLPAGAQPIYDKAPTD